MGGKKMRIEEEDIQSKIKRIIRNVVILVFLLIVLWSSFFVVPAGYQGVVFNAFVGVKPITYGEGMHLKLPFFEKPYKLEVRTRVYNEDASAASQDLQNVHPKVGLNYHIDKDNVFTLFKNVGIDYESRIINPSIQETVKSITAKHNAEDLIKQREKIKEEIKEQLNLRLSSYNLVMEDLSITNFDFSEEFNKAIEQKVTAEQNAQKEQNNLRVIEFQAQQRVLLAKGEAEAARQKAQGDADAIRIVNEQLSRSPSYVDYYLLQKWDGKMPLALGSGSLLSISNEVK